MSSNTTSIEEIEQRVQEWLGREVLVDHNRLYSGVSAVPSPTPIGTYMGIMTFEVVDCHRFRLMSAEGGEIAEIHAVYEVNAEGNRLFVYGWVGDPSTADWSQWIVEK